LLYRAFSLASNCRALAGVQIRKTWFFWCAPVTSTSGNRMSNDGVWTYTYDDAGNTIKKSKGASLETWEYSFDHRMRMTVAEKRATDGGSLQARVEYAYDPFGNRAWRKEFNGSLTLISNERFGYDGWNPSRGEAVGSENFDAVFDLDGADAKVLRRSYGDGVDDVMASMGGGIMGMSTWYRKDLLGSVRNTSNSMGSPQTTITYDAFGKVLSNSSPSNADRYLFTGREWDDALEMQYTRARMYDPATGRFYSADPLGLEAGDNNLFRYVGNMPTSEKDPSGQLVLVREEWAAQDLQRWFAGDDGTASEIYLGMKNPSPLTVTSSKMRDNLYLLDVNRASDRERDALAATWVAASKERRKQDVLSLTANAVRLLDAMLKGPDPGSQGHSLIEWLPREFGHYKRDGKSLIMNISNIDWTYINNCTFQHFLTLPASQVDLEKYRA